MPHCSDPFRNPVAGGSIAYRDDAARVFQPSSAYCSNLMALTIPI